jgi:hypothetical protein
MFSRCNFLSLLSVVPIAAAAAVTNFNYEIISNDTSVGRLRANNPASYEIEFTNYWTEGKCDAMPQLT